MARKARVRSLSGTYYVRITGDRIVALEDEDVKKITEILLRLKSEDFSEIYAYYIGVSDLWFLIKEGLSEIGDFIRKLKSEYAVWYNKKYKREGPLFDGRFKSLPIESGEQTVAAAVYIHRLGASDKDAKLRSSYNKYSSSNAGVIDKEPILLYAGGLRAFEDAHAAVPEFYPETVRLTDEELVAEIRRLLIGDADAFSDDEKFLAAVRKIKTVKGANVTQIARVLKVPRSVVDRA